MASNVQDNGDPGGPEQDPRYNLTVSTSFDNGMSETSSDLLPPLLAPLLAPLPPSYSSSLSTSSSSTSSASSSASSLRTIFRSYPADNCLKSLCTLFIAALHNL